METSLSTTQNANLSKKLIVLGVLTLCLWVASLFVWNLVAERQGRQTEASLNISQQWSAPQTISGPVLSIPVERVTLGVNGIPVITTDTLHVLPQKLSYGGQIETEVRSKGIFDTPVYTSALKGTGSFDLTKILKEANEQVKILWDKATLSIGVSDARGIMSIAHVVWDGTTHDFEASTQVPSISTEGIHTLIPLDPNNQKYDFTIDLTLKGSSEISFLPLSNDTHVALTSDWTAPNFIGDFLPTKRSLDPAGFTAEWNISSYSRTIPDYWYNTTGYELNTNQMLTIKQFGVGLYQEVNSYKLTDRALKYAILFIVLTFTVFLIYEILSGLRIHPIQYLLVGFGLILFYLLLLSLSEVIVFRNAYIISTIAITALITVYSGSVLKARLKAVSIGLLLIALYTYLFILIQLEELSLLFGSIFLFVVLAAIMFITRKFDWYASRNGQ